MNQRAILCEDFNDQSLIFDSTNRPTLQALASYARAAMKMGCRNPIWSKSAAQQLLVLTDAKKKEISDYLNLCAYWADNANYADKGVQEKGFLLKALDYYGLSVDKDLLETIDDETVVEIYSEDMLQLYRSFKMLDMTGYSLLDLSVFEWYVLWERPQLTIEQMQSEIAKVLESEIPFKTFNVAPHVLRETHDTGMTEPFIPRNALVNFQHIGYLKRTRPDAPRAFVCTAKGSIIAEGFAETKSLAFL